MHSLLSIVNSRHFEGDGMVQLLENYLTVRCDGCRRPDTASVRASLPLPVTPDLGRYVSLGKLNCANVIMLKLASSSVENWRD
jgi:hypothetical protein